MWSTDDHYHLTRYVQCYWCNDCSVAVAPLIRSAARSSTTSRSSGRMNPVGEFAAKAAGPVHPEASLECGAAGECTEEEKICRGLLRGNAAGRRWTGLESFLTSWVERIGIAAFFFFPSSQLVSWKAIELLKHCITGATKGTLIAVRIKAASTNIPAACSSPDHLDSLAIEQVADPSPLDH